MMISLENRSHCTKNLISCLQHCCKKSKIPLKNKKIYKSVVSLSIFIKYFSILYLEINQVDIPKNICKFKNFRALMNNALQ